MHTRWKWRAMGSSNRKYSSSITRRQAGKTRQTKFERPLPAISLRLDGSPELYETTGKEDVAEICRAACRRGASLVIAAGGDGTLVGVANGLVNSPVPLGIVPMGTGNYLARALQMPGSLDEALEVLAGDHVVHQVDALKVGDRCFFSNISVGISPEVVRNTKSRQQEDLRPAWPMSCPRYDSRAFFSFIATG